MVFVLIIITLQLNYKLEIEPKASQKDFYIYLLYLKFCNFFHTNATLQAKFV